MTSLDWLIIAGYSVFLLALGLFFTRRAGKSMEHYFVAGRSLPWWVLGLSASATYTGAGAAPAFTMLVFQNGLVGNWWWWLSFAVWMPLVAVIWSKLWRRLRVVTTAELLEIRYGGQAAALFRPFYALMMGLGWAVLLNGYVMGWLIRAMAPIFGWSDLKVLLLASGLILIYCTLSGLFGVVYSDVFQFFIFLIGNSLLVVVVLHEIGGLGALYSHLLSARGESFLQPLPPAGELTWMVLLFLFIQGLFFASSPSGGEGYTAQRFMAARNEFHAQAGQMFNAFITLVVRVIPFIILGMAGAALLPSSTDPERIWGILVARFSFSGLTGLLIAAELAAFMSTIDTHINWGSSFLINDLYRRFFSPKKEDQGRQIVLISRLTTAGLLILSVLVGYFLVDRMMAWFLFINSVAVAFMLPLSWLRFFWWRHNIYGEATAFLVGLPLAYIVWFPLGFSDPTRHPFWQGFLLLFGLGWLTILGVDLLTRPEARETLLNFYRRCQPPGLWGPVKKWLADEDSRLEIRATTGKDVVDSLLGIVFCLGAIVSLLGFFSLQWELLGGSLGVTLLAGVVFLRRWSTRGIFSGLKKERISSPQ
jgi:Na+/proline symporter